MPTSASKAGAAPVMLLLCAIGTVAAGSMAARYGLWWPRRLCWPRPPGIVLHHSASSAGEGPRAVDAALIDRWHERRGWGLETATASYHIGYHYVILPNGAVEPGRPDWMPGAHAVGHNDCIGICLIGNFSSSANPRGLIKPARPTPEQLDSLHSLLLRLVRKYDLDLTDIHRHRDLAQTACPGDRFPFDAVMKRLRDGLSSREPD